MLSRIRTTGVGSYPVLPWMAGNKSRLVLRDAVMVVLTCIQPVNGRVAGLARRSFSGGGFESSLRSPPHLLWFEPHPLWFPNVNSH